MRPILEECRGVARLRGSPVRDTWWELDLTPPPEPERVRDGHPHHQPTQAAASPEEQQATWRTEWEERQEQAPDAQAELDRLWAHAHLPSNLI